MLINIYNNIYSVFNVIYDKLTDKMLNNEIKHNNIKRINDYNIITRSFFHIKAPFKKITYICDNLYLGNAYNASNYSYLKNNNINVIINATNEITNYFPNDFIYYKLDNLYDNNVSNINIYFDKYLKFLNNNINKKILIHCYMGSSRSVCLILLYLIKYKHMSIDESIIYLQSKTNTININLKFINDLKIYIKDNKFK